MEEVDEATAKAQRVNERRQRVSERAAKKSEGENGDPAGQAAAATSKAMASKAVTQVSQSVAKIDATKARTIEDVTNIRVAAEARERDRRAAEASRVAERQAKLKEEAASAARANAAVTMKWDDIKAKNLPQELSDELQQQQSACASILESKDRLVGTLNAELKHKDEEYIKALAQQRADIDALLQRMRTQFDELRESYAGELEAIEGSFLAERDELLAANKKDIDALFEQRRSMESKYAEEKVTREENYATELYDMQAADAENYQKLKVKLETDVAILEQQLEHMKFTYLLNTEKLEYNYRVLTERDNENKATLAAQKSRLARLRTSLSKVQSDYEASDAKFKQKNEALTQEYQRTTRQYRDLQAKFRHFEAADAARYNAVVGVHLEEMTAMADRLLSADRVITEQLLGREWSAPADADAAAAAHASTGHQHHHHHHHHHSRHHSTSGGATAGASSSLSATGSSVAAAAAIANGGYADGGDGASDGGRGSELMFGNGGAVPPSPSSAAASNDGVGSGVDPSKLRPLLSLLVDECSSFLLDSATLRTCDKMDRNGRAAQAAALRADALLKAIGCDSAAGVASLVDTFESALADAGSRVAASSSSSAGAPRRGRDVDDGRYDDDDEDDTLSGSGSGAGGDVYSLAIVAGDGLPILPPGVNPIRILRGWIEMVKSGQVQGVGAAHKTELLKRLEAAEQQHGHTHKADLNATGGGGATQSLGKSGKTGAGTYDLTQFDRLANAVPPSRIRVWKALETGLDKYQKVLHKRSAVLSEVESLSKANEEMKNLLAVYLSDSNATALQVPPSQTLKLGAHTQNVTQHLGASMASMSIGGHSQVSYSQHAAASNNETKGYRSDAATPRAGAGTASSGMLQVSATGGAGLYRPRP